MLTDVGRRFLVTRVLELLIELDETDVVEDQAAEDTVTSIASGIPLADWSLIATDAEEVS